MNNKILSELNVRSLIDCNVATGKLYWKERPVELFRETSKRSAQNNCNLWNSKNAGQEAFITPSTRGYLQGCFYNKIYQAHRVVWLWVHERWPENDIDHLDGDKTNNCIDNLADKTPLENNKNRAFNTNNTSGYKGVFWNKERQKWRAQIFADGRQFYLGLYETKEEAFSAYVSAAKQFGFTERHIFG